MLRHVRSFRGLWRAPRRHLALVDTLELGGQSALAQPTAEGQVHRVHPPGLDPAVHGVPTSDIAAQVGQPMRVFDRHAHTEQRRRAQRLRGADAGSFLHREVAGRLVERLDDVTSGLAFPRALAVGPVGDGAVLRWLQGNRAAVDQFYHMDLVAPTLPFSPTVLPPRGLRPLHVVGDEERLAAREDSWDLVVSALGLHWVNDLPGTLIQFRRSLREEGLFLGAMLGGATLQELRHAMTVADVERRGGVSAHVSPMAGPSDVATQMQRAAFTGVAVDVDDLVVHYPDAWALWYDLQRMGETNCQFIRGTCPKDTFLAASAALHALYWDDVSQSIPITYQVVYMMGWSPFSPSHQKPRRPGSQQLHMGHLGDVFSPQMLTPSEESLEQLPEHVQYHKRKQLAVLEGARVIQVDQLELDSQSPPESRRALPGTSSSMEDEDEPPAELPKR